MVDPEKRKEYNKTYYSKKKEDIAKKLYEKKECPHCHRMVNHQYLPRHMKSSICAKNDNEKMIEKLMNRIEELRK